jgi:hypothetical protein
MRLAVVSALAALVAAPLAAEAAEPPARWSATLQASVVDNFQYRQSRLEGRCRISRTGSSGRQLTLRSLRGTRVQVRRDAKGVTFGPSRLLAVRVTGGTTPGSAVETRFCPGEPLDRREIDCPAVRSAPWRARPGFRAAGRSAIAFDRAVHPTSVCGLDRRQPGGWLHLALGSTDLDALVADRSRRVVVRARAVREATSGGFALEVTQTSTVRWTLTFRRR